MRIAILLWVALLARPAMAEFKVSISASDKLLGTEDALEVTVEITNPPPGTTIDWPAAPDFESVNSTSTSTSRNATREITVRSEMRSFRPTRKGALSFPALVVRTALGSTLSTEKVSLDVIDGHVAGATRAVRKKQVAAEVEPVVPDDSKDVFLEARLSAKSQTLGDPLGLNLGLWVRVGVEISAVDEIRFELPEGFVVVELDQDALPDSRKLGGVDYRKFQLRHARVLPLKVGTFNIAPPVVQVTIGRGDAATRHSITTNVAALEVTPANDARTSFTAEEAAAILRRRAQRTDPLKLKMGAGKQVKSIQFGK